MTVWKRGSGGVVVSAVLLACGGPPQAPQAAELPEGAPPDEAAADATVVPSPGAGQESSPEPAAGNVANRASGHLEPVRHVISSRCAITKGGQLRCWGRRGEVPVPAGSYVAVAGNEKGVNCGVRSDGTAACWDTSKNGAVWPTPPGHFVTVTPGDGNVICGIRQDRAAECWQVAAKRRTDPLAIFNQRTFPGKYAQAMPRGSYIYLLNASGHLTGASIHKQVKPPKVDAGPYREFGHRHVILPDGRIAGMLTPGKPGKPKEGSYLARHDLCDLSTDGVIVCSSFRGKDRRKGPYVDLQGGCALRPDGKVSSIKGGCAVPKDVVVEVPEALRARLIASNTKSVLDHLDSLEKARAAGGAAKEYRVAFRSRIEGHYFVVDKRGVFVSAQNHDVGPHGVYGQLQGGSDLRLVDLNGGELQPGDAIHLKRGNSYVVVGDPGEPAITLSAKARPTARWTLHTSAVDRETGEAEPFSPPARGILNVLLRASTGQFLIPCSKTTCTNPPEGVKLQKAGGLPDIGPWWVPDPFFDSLYEEDRDTMMLINTQWHVWPVVDCDYEAPFAKGRQRGVCSMVPSTEGTLLQK